jgi:hypothetical protein
MTPTTKPILYTEEVSLFFFLHNNQAHLMNLSSLWSSGGLFFGCNSWRTPKHRDLILCREIIAVCSRIRNEHQYSMWAERRIL